MGLYLRPRTVDEAVAALKSGDGTIIAGGTDHFPARVGRAPDENLIDISAVDGLRGIVENDEGWRIGAGTTWTDILEADLPPLFDGLRQAAREVGGVQIQNVGTIAGNLCNASPAADGVPPLMAMNAWIELRYDGGIVSMPVRDFILGNRKTWRRSGDLATAILVRRPASPMRSGFLKIGARRYLVISIAMVAATVEIEEGHVVRAAVVVGACSPVARHLRSLEDRLIGRKLDATLDDAVRLEDFAALSPLDDVRADAAYRLEAACVAVRRVLAGIGSAG